MVDKKVSKGSLGQQGNVNVTVTVKAKGVASNPDFAGVKHSSTYKNVSIQFLDDVQTGLAALQEEIAAKHASLHIDS